jgi:hypothetical protein
MRCSYLMVVGGLLLGPQAMAEVYRWVDDKGVVHYGDRAPDAKTQPAVLPELQVIPAGPKPAPVAVPAGEGVATAPSAPLQAEPPKLKISITTPTPEQVFHDTSREVPVRVELGSPLPEGAVLMYYLDGRAQNAKATREFSATLRDVDRGSHLIDVAIVDASGRQLIRTPPLIVHVQPPTKRTN